MGWTEERIEILKRLWAEGLSGEAIAAQLGGVSRNSVIAKIHRLGVSGRAKPAGVGGRSGPRRRKSTAKAPPKPKPAKREPWVKVPSATTSPAPPRAATVERNSAIRRNSTPRYLQAGVEIERPEPKNLTLLSLKDNTCKFSTGGESAKDGYLFCGAPTFEYRPYCEYHCRVAYRLAGRAV